MTLEFPPANTTTAQEIASGLSMHYAAEDTIAVLTVSNNVKVTMEAYAGAVSELVRVWRLGQPLLLLHVLTDARLSLTPFARDKFAEVFSTLKRTSRAGRSALVLDSTNTRWLAAVSQTNTRGSKNMRHALYYTYAEAEAWIRQPSEPTK